MIRSALLIVALASTLAPAAALEGGDLAALEARLSSPAGGPTLVNFWATWCIPCLKEMPRLAELQDRLGPRGLRVLAVSVDAFVYPDPGDARRRVERMVAREGFTVPVFLYEGEEAALAEAFDLPATLPHTVLLGPDGAVLDAVEGELQPEEIERLEGRMGPHLE